jgi:hypothetical protein
MSLSVIGQWVEYVFRTAKSLLGLGENCDEETSAMIRDVQAYCSGRVHNIWGADRNEDNPEITLHYDIGAWLHSPLSTPLSEFKFVGTAKYRFAFPRAKQEEMAAQIKRYGTTTTGIGRIMAQMGRDRIWREPEVVQGAVIARGTPLTATQEPLQVPGF